MVTGRTCRRVLFLGLLASCPAGGEFCFFEGRRRPVEDEHRDDARFKERHGALKEAHQVGHVTAIRSAEGHAVPLWRSVAHRREELKRSEEGVDANPLACKVGKANANRRGEVLQVAAHGSTQGSSLERLRLRRRDEKGAALRRGMVGEGRAVVVLRGLTTGLAAAETAALGMRIEERRGRLLRGTAPDLTSAAGIDAVLDGGGLAAWTGHDDAVACIMRDLHLPNGPLAVRVERLGGKVAGCSTQALA